MLHLLQHHLYALAVGGAALLYAAGLHWQLALAPLVLAWSLLVLAAGGLLERRLPFDADWHRPRADVRTDATSAVLLVGGVDPLLKAALPVLTIALLGEPGPGKAGLAGLPLALQVLLALLWIEFAKYWMHRWHHEVPALWRLHALHHGSERLYWLNNFRFHPLNHVFNTLASLLPLWLLGLPEAALLGATALTQPVVMLQHMNIDLRSGWLNHVLSTNEAHRWHHSSRPDEANANYGSALLLWDRLFGTFQHRPAPQRPAAIGLFGASRGYPARASYWRQLLGGWQPACCRG